LLIRARLRRDQRFDLFGVISLQLGHALKAFAYSVEPFICPLEPDIERGYIVSERANALRKLYLRVNQRIKSSVCVEARLILPINAFFLDSCELDKQLVRLFKPRLARFKANLGVDQCIQLLIRGSQRSVMSINALFLDPDELDDRLMRLGNLLDGLIEALLPRLISYLRLSKLRLVASYCL
jgi:hypothetical protein